MRGWTGATSALAAVVRIVKVRPSQSPARASAPPSAGWNQRGIFPPSSFAHS